MFTLSIFLKVHQKTRISHSPTPVSIYRAYTAMATDPNKYRLNRKYPSIDIAWET